MCFSSGSATKEVAPAPPAPEPVPESVAPADASLENGRDSLKIKRKGISNYRTDLNIPTSSGSGLNVPR